MKFLNLILTTSVLYSTHVLAAFRPDLRENVQVAELEPDQRIDADATEIPLKAYPGSDFEIIFKCVDGSKQFTFADNKRFVACCTPDQQLLGSEATAFDCCNTSEELVGCADTGYVCCPAGMSYEECNGIVKPVICPDSEILVNDQCVCPPGTFRSATGACEDLQCSSGIQSGKCYTFTLENGFRFGYNSAGFYTASEESRAQQFGKFQFCSSECCSFDNEINPGQPFYIKDLHGSANGGLDAKQWLDNAKDGSHIAKTPEFSQAGAFTITKWPCGKYCLSGLESGLGPTCPSEMLGATFTTADDQSCIPLTLLEVPCDIRSAGNNCLWETDGAPCSKKTEIPTCNVEISATGSVPVPVPVQVPDESSEQILF